MESYNFNKSLGDFGANINLMPLSPTTMFLQLVEHSIKHPKGILEDTLVKENKFIFPIDFIVLDIKEDQEILIISRRSFLVIGEN